MDWRIEHLTPKAIGAVAITLLLVIVWFAQPVFGTSPDSMPQARPTLPRPGPGSGGGSSGGGSASESGCAGVWGTVINWGYHNEPGVTFRAEGDTYMLTQISASDGRYAFRGLGQGYIVLRPVLVGAQKNLNIHTDEVALLLRCDQQPVLNVGIYSGERRPQPPAHLLVSANDTEAKPGETIRFNITARNDLPTGISNVIITDLFPQGLKILSAKASRGTPEVINDSMFSLFVGDMDSGEEVTVTISVRVNRWASTGKKMVNRTTMLYAESMADQVVSTVTVGEGVTIGTDRGPIAVAMVVDESAAETEETVSALSIEETSEEPSAPEPSSEDLSISAFSIEETGEEPSSSELSVSAFSIPTSAEEPATSELTETEPAITAFSIETTETMATPEPASTEAMISAFSVDIAGTSEISSSRSLTDTASINGRLPVTGGMLNLLTLPLLGLALVSVAFLAKLLRGQTT